jgi:hypothetical protein
MPSDNTTQIPIEIQFIGLIAGAVLLARPVGGLDMAVRLSKPRRNVKFPY